MADKARADAKPPIFSVPAPAPDASSDPPGADATPRLPAETPRAEQPGVPVKTEVQKPDEIPDPGSPVPVFPAVPADWRYEFVSELGVGGMGAVYQAKDKELNRLVAIKTIRPEYAHVPELRIRFKIEAEALARLSHPNVVSVHEVGRIGAGGPPFMALELVTGGNLSGWLDKHRPSLTDVDKARLIATVADGVGAAHRVGVIHRDLKPVNVLLAPTDPPGVLSGGFTPKVADFGLARLDDRELTQPGAVMGTYAYMSPEQVDGHASKITAATDVWALGVMLYDLLCGSMPFHRPNQRDLMSDIRDVEPRRLGPKTSRTPADLAVICHKCLHKDPARRYQTANELAADLRNWLADRPITARPVGRGERTVKLVRRNPVWATAAFSMVALLGLGVYALLNSLEKERAENRELAALAETLDTVDDEANELADDESLKAADIAQTYRQKRLRSAVDKFAGKIERVGVTRIARPGYAKHLLTIGLLHAESGPDGVDQEIKVTAAARDILHDLWTESPDDIDVRGQYAKATHRLANAYQKKADPAYSGAADDLYREAIDIRRRLPAEEARVGLATSLTNRACLRCADGAPAGVDPVELLDEAELLLRPRIGREPADLSAELQLGYVFDARGRAYRVRGQFPEAVVDYDNAANTFARLTGCVPADRPHTRYTARHRWVQATANAAQARLDDDPPLREAALRMLDQAQDAARALNADRPDNEAFLREWVRVGKAHANARLNAGEYDNADVLNRQLHTWASGSSVCPDEFHRQVRFYSLCRMAHAANRRGQHADERARLEEATADAPEEDQRLLPFAIAHARLYAGEPADRVLRALTPATADDPADVLLLRWRLYQHLAARATGTERGPAFEQAERAGAAFHRHPHAQSAPGQLTDKPWFQSVQPPAVSDGRTS